MAARNPDFATLSEEALDAADLLLLHMDVCTACTISTTICKVGGARKTDYRAKRDKALKAIRGRKKA